MAADRHNKARDFFSVHPRYIAEVDGPVYLPSTLMSSRIVENRRFVVGYIGTAGVGMPLCVSSQHGLREAWFWSLLICLSNLQVHYFWKMNHLRILAQ